MQAEELSEKPVTKLCPREPGSSVTPTWPILLLYISSALSTWMLSSIQCGFSGGRVEWVSAAVISSGLGTMGAGSGILDMSLEDCLPFKES